MNLDERVKRMREGFLKGSMTDVNKRIELLKKLKTAVSSRADKIAAALKSDFNKNAFDAYATEIGLVLGELTHFIKRLKGYAKIKKVSTSLVNFPSKGYIYPEGYGVALIVAPWNYPFQLSLVPLIGAIAAGNCVVLKTAARTKATGAVIGEIIKEAFDESQVYHIDNAFEREDVLSVRYDYIFFTGGTSTGKKVMERAAKFLTPLTLELGGKSPCIVDESADLKLSARRLSWGKFLNAGQTCIAPDYLLVHEKVEKEFIGYLKEEIRAMYYESGALSEEFPYLSSLEKADEMRALLKDAEILEGGEIEGRVMRPTLIKADFCDSCMQEEIFAPLLPVLTFSSLEQTFQKINDGERPLAFYYFGKRGDEAALACKFGGGCINDCIMHISEGKLPFGGVGMSGMGSYHHKASFDTFTHYKSVLKKGKFDLKTRYAPHSEKDLKLVKILIK